MNLYVLRRFQPILAAAMLFGLLAADSADAQHDGDISFQQVSDTIVLPEGRLYTSVWLAGGFPPTPGPPPVESEEPGFEAADGALPALTAVMLRIVQPLHYWSNGGVTRPAPFATVVQVESKGGETIEIDRSGIPHNDSLVLGASDEDGGFHQHARWKLPETTAPPGAYGLVMQLSLSSELESAPFLVVFGQQISLGELETAAAEIWATSGIADGALAADFNLDQQVEAADLAAWRVGFGAQAYALLGDGDADRDADVDGADFLAWQREVTTAPPTLAIPEPTGPFGLCWAGATTVLLGRASRIACTGLKRPVRRWANNHSGQAF